MASRENHYVPRWYQEGFFEPGKNTLAYLDLKPVQYESLSGRIQTALPAQGIQDHTINRLLLMSSSEHHLSRVPMAFFIRSAGAAAVNPVPRRLYGLP